MRLWQGTSRGASTESDSDDEYEEAKFQKSVAEPTGFSSSFSSRETEKELRRETNSPYVSS